MKMTFELGKAPAMTQEQIARLDSDIVAWLRRSGKGYQTRLNAILKRVMLEDMKTRRAVYY